MTMILVLGTVPFALGGTSQTTTSSSVYISSLYVGAPHQTINQEYVKITNKGTTAVSMKGWKITESLYQNYKYYFSECYCGDMNGIQRTL
nr:lamin tail domain-containing protein [uncultured Methanomethylovorans sp.]